jgi:hypothetical protein
MWFQRAGRPERQPVREFRPTRARQKQESKRLRPVAVLPALALLTGACIGILNSSDRAGALFIYLGLFGFSAFVAVIIVGILTIRNRKFLAETTIRLTDHAIEYTDAKGRVIAFDRTDPSLTSLLAWVSSPPNDQGVNLPPSLTLFMSDQARSIRLRGSDWAIEDLDAIASAARTRLRPSDAAHGGDRQPGSWPGQKDVDETPAIWEVIDAKQVNELIPGTMSFRETHPLTFALLIGFGSAALLLVVVFAVGFAVGF